MPVRRFMDGLPDDIIRAGFNCVDDRRIFGNVFYLKLHPVAYGNWVSHFEAHNFEFTLEPPLVNMTVLVADIIPRTRGAKN